MLYQEEKLQYKMNSVFVTMRRKIGGGIYFAALLVFAAMLFGGIANAQNENNRGKMDKNDRDMSDMKRQKIQGGQYAEINGARIYYEVAGSGAPMLLIHGYPLSSDLYRDQRSELSKRYQVITPDLRGFGKSTAPDDDASLSVYAKDMLGLMDKLGIQKAIIGGHSMGGMTVIEMYKQAPERFSGMILIDTAAIPAPIANAEWWKGFAEQGREKGVASIVPLLVPNMLTGKARMNNMPLVTYMENMIKAASVNGVVGGGKALAERPDNTGVLSTIRVPTLIIVGVEDTLTPMAIAKSMNQAIPNSKLEIIDGGSHAVIIEESKRANKAIMKWANGMR